MKVGDLVRFTSTLPSDGDLYEWWGDRTRGASRITGRFSVVQLGILLDDNRPTGGNGCKVLTSGGQVGWLFAVFLEPVKTSVGLV